MKILLSALLAFLALLLITPRPAHAQLLKEIKQKKKEHKDDVVIMDNGDRLTGEIKKMQQGMLYFKSDRAIGTLQLDWKKVQHLQSSARYQFEVIGGKRYIGIIDSNAEPGNGLIAVNAENSEPVQLKIPDIVEIHEMQQAFLGRLNLSLDAGITYTQSNNQTQTNLQSSLQYSKPRSSFTLDINSIFNAQSSGTNTSRHEGTLIARRNLLSRWDYILVGGLLHDSQQDLDLRVTGGGGFERIFSKTNRTLFSGAIGFVYSGERYSAGENRNRNNGEILTGLNISTYRFRSSELRAYGFVFPSMTDPGRVRADVSAYWKWDIVSDLYWKVSSFENFDSRPPEGFRKNSFGISNSIGWSF